MELSRFGRSHFCRRDRLTNWYRQDLYVGPATGLEVKKQLVNKANKNKGTEANAARCNMITRMTSRVDKQMQEKRRGEEKLNGDDKEDKVQDLVEKDKAKEAKTTVESVQPKADVETEEEAKLRRRDGQTASLRELVNLLTSESVPEETAQNLPTVQTLIGRCTAATFNGEENVEMIGKHLRTIGNVDGKIKVIVIATGADVSLIGQGSIKDQSRVPPFDRVNEIVTGIGVLWSGCTSMRTLRLTNEKYKRLGLYRLENMGIKASSHLYNRAQPRIDLVGWSRFMLPSGLRLGLE